MPNRTEFDAELDRLAADLRQLRADCGSPTLNKIVLRSASLPGGTSLSVSALSEAFNGKRLQRVDTLMSLVRTLLSYRHEGEQRLVGRSAPEMEVWRARWRHVEQLRSLNRRARAGDVLEQAAGPLVLRALEEDLARGYAVPLTPFEAPTDSCEGLAFSPDGRFLALGCSDGSVHLWDPATGEEAMDLLVGHRDIVRDLAFSPDGRLLASSADDGTVWMSDVTFRSPVGGSLPGGEGIAGCVAFSPDGTLLAAAASNGRVYLWDTRTRELSSTLTDGHGPDHAVEFSPDGSILAAVGSNGVMRLWKCGSWEVLADQAVGECCDLAFSPNGKLLAAAGSDGSLRLWDPFASEAGAVTEELIPAGGEAVSAVVFSPDGRLLACAIMDGAVRIWDLELGQPVAADPLSTSFSEAYSVAFSTCGGILNAVGDESSVQVWITPFARTS